MKAGWQTKPFEGCIEHVAYTSKIQRKDFLDDGTYPVVSQEVGLVNGYWNNEADLFAVGRPVIIFGDHTKVLKYVDFDFVLGADGVKILQPKDFLVPRFFYYQLQVAQLDTLGYARRNFSISHGSHKINDLELHKTAILLIFLAKAKRKPLILRWRCSLNMI